jgi:hypothetical protein
MGVPYRFIPLKSCKNLENENYIYLNIFNSCNSLNFSGEAGRFDVA